jgi:hypothetical protein
LPIPFFATAGKEEDHHSEEGASNHQPLDGEPLRKVPGARHIVGEAVTPWGRG